MGSVPWGVNDRGYAIHQDGKGSAYIGGVSGSTAMLLKVGDIETAKPKLGWAKKVELGVGGNINSMDVDRVGNVFVPLDAPTTLDIVRTRSLEFLVKCPGVNVEVLTP